MQQSEIDKEGPRSFTHVLEHLGDGDCKVQMSGELHELIKVLASQAHTTGKRTKGRLTLTLEFEVDPHDFVQINYKTTRKEPNPKQSGGAMWVSKGGNLTPHHPRQQEMSFPKEIPGGKSEPRDVGGDDDNDAKEA